MKSQSHANEPGFSTSGEFVELVNVGGSSIDISGWTLSDATAVRHTFASGTVLAPGKALVVFGSASGIHAGLSNAVGASTAQLNLANSTDTVTLRNTAAGSSRAALAGKQSAPSGRAAFQLVRPSDQLLSIAAGTSPLLTGPALPGVGTHAWVTSGTTRLCPYKRINPMRRKLIASLGLLGLMVMGTQARADTCYTYCLGAVQIACESGRIINACVGAWTCDAGLGAHTCDPGPSECKSDGDCVAGYRCAKPVFGTNWCAKECDDNSDCFPGTKCKKPFGASFRRCQ